MVNQKELFHFCQQNRKCKEFGFACCFWCKNCQNSQSPSWVHKCPILLFVSARRLENPFCRLAQSFLLCWVFWEASSQHVCKINGPSHTCTWSLFVWISEVLLVQTMTLNNKAKKGRAPIHSCTCGRLAEQRVALVCAKIRNTEWSSKTLVPFSLFSRLKSPASFHWSWHSEGYSRNAWDSCFATFSCSKGFSKDSESSFVGIVQKVI